MVTVFRKEKSELFALSMNGKVSWCEVNGINAGVQENEWQCCG